MAADLNFPQYFARIGYSGPNTPTLVALQELCVHHFGSNCFRESGKALDLAMLQSLLTRVDEMIE